MKIAVFSDSHGSVTPMLRAIKAYDPDMIIHLGDYSRDADAIKEQFPQTAVRAVRGNCDIISRWPETDIIDICSRRLFITHGHLQGVKASLDRLIIAARLHGADIVLFGHTHSYCLKTMPDGLTAINPGHAGNGGGYVRLELSEDGSFNCRVFGLA